MVNSFVKRNKPLFSRGRNFTCKDGEQNSNVENNSNNRYTNTKTIQGGNDDKAIPAVVIVGAGIVGLVLALALDKHCGIQAELYEQAPAFHDDVGAGMGMYPNGLRVIRDISRDLLHQIQQAGCPYVIRRIEVSPPNCAVQANLLQLFSDHRLNISMCL